MINRISLLTNIFTRILISYDTYYYYYYYYIPKNTSHPLTPNSCNLQERQNNSHSRESFLNGAFCFNWLWANRHMLSVCAWLNGRGKRFSETISSFLCVYFFTIQRERVAMLFPKTRYILYRLKLKLYSNSTVVFLWFKLCNSMPDLFHWPRHRLSGPAWRSECVHIDRGVAATWIPLTYIRQIFNDNH